MSDKFLPPEGISEGAASKSLAERRAFLRRAVSIGVPVVLATVRGRPVLAQGPNPENLTTNGSGCASMAPSGWLGEDRNNLEDLRERTASCDAWETANPGGVGTSAPAEPIVDPAPPPE